MRGRGARHGARAPRPARDAGGAALRVRRHARRQQGGRHPAGGARLRPRGARASARSPRSSRACRCRRSCSGTSTTSSSSRASATAARSSTTRPWGAGRWTRRRSTRASRAWCSPSSGARTSRPAARRPRCCAPSRATSRGWGHRWRSPWCSASPSWRRVSPCRGSWGASWTRCSPRACRAWPRRSSRGSSRRRWRGGSSRGCRRRCSRPRSRARRSPRPSASSPTRSPCRWISSCSARRARSPRAWS